MKSNIVTIKFVPLQTKRRFEEVSAKIKELIINGTLKPGDRLPSEMEVARQFKVGRQTIREALRCLELSGFITIQRGGQGGPIIENTIMNTLSNLFLDAIEISNTSIQELTVARLQIETSILREVMKHINDGDIASLKENIANAKAHLSDGFQAFRENINFHKLLAKASKNHVFEIVIEGIMTVVANFLSRREQPSHEESSRVTMSHEAILNEIVHGNDENAISLMEAHLWRVDGLFSGINRWGNSDSDSL